MRSRSFRAPLLRGPSAPTAALAVCLLLSGGAVGKAAAQAPLPSPEAYFGFAMGTDRTLARWDSIVSYFEVLASGSDRLRVDTLGPTTLGNPFVVVTLSSAENLARLEEIRDASRSLGSGRLDRSEAEALAASIPVTVVINHNIHSTEIASSQTSVKLVHRLATATDAETREILDNVVTVLIPSANPDGQIMVTDWYRRNVGTDFEDARMPYLYHHYAGHDNNRDFFQGNLVETRYWMDVMFRTAYPQLYLDQHQMGSTGPRMFVPPYPDPMDPDIHPLQWQSLRFMGGSLVADLQRAGKQGVITAQMYRIWGQEGALTGRHHNIVALLTETASANIASPVTITRQQLNAGARRLGPGARYDYSMNFADPWWGGEWTLGDIVAYQDVAATSFLRLAARYRERWLMGRWQMVAETLERARASGIHAVVIPADQTDPVAAADLARRLSWQGIEVFRAVGEFEATVAERGPRPQTRDPEKLAAWLGVELDEGGEGEGDEAATEGDEPTEAEGAEERPGPALATRTFPAGSWVIPAEQNAWAAIEDLLVPQARELDYEYPGGPFKRSYDGAAYTLPLQMGVDVALVSEPFDGDLVALCCGGSSGAAAAGGSRAGDSGSGGARGAPPLLGGPDPVTLPGADRWLAMSGAVARSYHVANALLAEGHRVSRAGDDFVVDATDAAARDALARWAGATGVPVVADPDVEGTPEPLRRTRVGLYQGWASSMDEGWTRYILEDYGFDLTVLGNDDVQSEDLARNLDVVIIPSEIPVTRLLNGADEDDQPEGYRGGIGEEGVENLKAFVRGGGTLVTLDRADELVLRHFDVPVRNALRGSVLSEVFAPASIYRLELDADHPLAAGSGGQVAAKWASGRAWEPTDWQRPGVEVRAVGRWPSDPERIVLSGLLAGGEHLAGKAALLDVIYGEGHIYMYGFRVQHRAQTVGTFKLLFNALMQAQSRPMS